MDIIQATVTVINDVNHDEQRNSGRCYSTDLMSSTGVTTDCKPNPPFQATIIWNEIVAELRTRVPGKHRRINKKCHERCFMGVEVVDCVYCYMSTHESQFDHKQVTREKVVKLCQLLVDFRIIAPLPHVSDRVRFEDSRTRYYCYLDKNGRIDRDIATSSSSSALSDNAFSSQSRITSVKEEEDEGDRISIASCDVISNRAALTQSSKTSLLSLNSSTSIGVGWKRRSADCIHDSRPRSSLAKYSRRSSLPFCEPASPGDLEQTSSPSDQVIDDGELLREIALSNLLLIVDLPILDGIVNYEGTTSRRSTRSNNPLDRSPLVFANTNLQRIDSVSSVFYSSSENKSFNDWWSLAVHCLNALSPSSSSYSSYPVLPASDPIDLSLPSSRENIRKLELFSTIADRCVLADPIWPPSFEALHIELYRLVMRGSMERVLRAFRLAIALLDEMTVQRFRHVLTFMNYASDDAQVKLNLTMSNRCTVERTFSTAIIRSHVLTPHQTGQLNTFMIDRLSLLWTVPNDITDIVIQKLSAASQEDIRCGRLPTLNTEQSFCQRISVAAFNRERVTWTNKCLVELMNAILDDTRLSLKNKKHYMKLFSKHHTALYLKYFPGMV